MSIYMFYLIICNYLKNKNRLFTYNKYNKINTMQLMKILNKFDTKLINMQFVIYLKIIIM